MSANKILQVVAALVLHPDSGNVLICQKPSGLWEFPGGKLEPGESLFAGAIREVKEELNIIIYPKKTFGFVAGTPEGKNFEIHLHGIFSKAKELDSFKQNEHIDHKWIPVRELRSFEGLGKLDILLAHKFTSVYLKEF